MMRPRIQHSYQTYTASFWQADILVVCPACSGKAVVKSGDYALHYAAEAADARVACAQCGYNKRLSERPRPVVSTAGNKVVWALRHYVIGRAADPFFHLPLWLKTDFGAHTLWAYNPEHLDFLQRHIEAGLRERNGQVVANRSLGSRLPKWMTAANNREALRKKIAFLQEKCNSSDG